MNQLLEKRWIASGLLPALMLLAITPLMAQPPMVPVPQIRRLSWTETPQHEPVAPPEHSEAAAPKTAIGGRLDAAPKPDGIDPQGENLESPEGGDESETARRSAQQLQALITEIVRDNLPDQYEKRQNWGAQRRVFDGVYVKRQGLRLETHRRWKHVNHGTWKMYRVTLLNPEETFQIRLIDIQELDQGRIQVTLEVDAVMHVFGRIAEWNRGVRVFSVSGNAQAGVSLRVVCNLGLKLNPLKLPPDVTLDPVVTEANLRLTAFRLHSIGDLHGPVVRELGRGARELIEDKLAEDPGKLVEKINRQIDKHRDKLTLSLQDVIRSQWGGLVAEQLGIDAAESESEE